MKIKINKEKWSESSKKSSMYDDTEKYYWDISFDCIKCKKIAVLSAEEQKHWYETKKYYVWKHPTLCSSCLENYSYLKNELLSFEKQWLNTPKEEKSNIQYAKKWLRSLQKIASYGKKSNESMISKLMKIIHKT